MIAEKVELNWSRTFKVFWSISWRTYLASLALTFVVMGFSAAVGVARGASDSSPFVTGLGGLMALVWFAGSLYAQLHVFRFALRCRWSDFELRPATSEGVLVELTLRRTLKVWWSFAWRTWVYLLGALVPFAILVGLGSVVIAQLPRAFAALLILAAIVGTLAGIVFVVLSAVRVALAVEWSDFKLFVIARTPEIARN